MIGKIIFFKLDVYFGKSNIKNIGYKIAPNTTVIAIIKIGLSVTKLNFIKYKAPAIKIDAQRGGKSGDRYW